MTKIVVGEFDDTLGYDCMYGGIRVGRVVLDGSNYGQKGCEPITRDQLKAMQDDANLIAEAFNVAHETGLTPHQLAEQRAELLDALHEGRRAIGDHHVPNDCYATGPMTGDQFRDLVQCPACSFIAMYDAVIAKVTGQATKRDSAEGTE